MGQRSTTEILTPAADRKPAVAGGGLRISQFDQVGLPESASVALTWICLAGPASAPKA